MTTWREMGWKAPRERNCKWCGTPFEAHHHLAELCSEPCRSSRAAQRRRDGYRRRADADPDKYREKRREWREANPDYFNEWARKNPERSREIKQGHAARHKDRIKARRRELYLADREADIRRSVEWAASNIVASREIKRRYRAMRFGVPVHDISAVDIVARMSMFGDKCWMCGGAFEHIDHVKPLSAGGAHMLSNLRPACKSCNSRKGNSWPPPEWAGLYRRGIR